MTDLWSGRRRHRSEENQRPTSASAKTENNFTFSNDGRLRPVAKHRLALVVGQHQLHVDGNAGEGRGHLRHQVVLDALADGSQRAGHPAHQILAGVLLGFRQAPRDPEVTEEHLERGAKAGRGTLQHEIDLAVHGGPDGDDARFLGC